MNYYDNKTYAKMLIDSNTFSINEQNPFRWTSGLEMPFYCDQRSLLSNVKIRKKIVSSLCLIIQNLHNFEKCSVVGVVSAGVPWASMISQELNLPLGYVRSQKKDHGKKNAIEGNIDPSMPVIIIEDLVSTAKSLIQAYIGLKEEGFSPYYSFALFTYNFKIAIEELKKINLPLQTLSDFNTLNSIRSAPIKLTDEQKSYFSNL